MKGRGRDPGLLYLLLTLALVILLGFLFWKPKETQNENPIEKEIVENIEEVKEEAISENDLESDEVEYIENDDLADLKEDNKGQVYYDGTLVNNLIDNSKIEENIYNKLSQYLVFNLNKVFPNYTFDTANINYAHRDINTIVFEPLNKNNNLNYNLAIEFELDKKELEKNKILIYLKTTDLLKNEVNYLTVNILLRKDKVRFNYNDNENIKEYKIKKYDLLFDKVSYDDIKNNITNFTNLESFKLNDISFAYYLYTSLNFSDIDFVEYPKSYKDIMDSDFYKELLMNNFVIDSSKILSFQEFINENKNLLNIYLIDYNNF